jgi:hypothetical protein
MRKVTTTAGAVMGMVLFGLSATGLCAEQPASTNPAAPAVKAPDLSGLCADGFRRRREARRNLIETVRALDEAVLDCLEAVETDGESEEPARDCRLVAERAARFYGHLETALTNSTDPELVFGVNAVLQAGRFSASFFDLRTADQALARLPFETRVHPGAAAVSRATYGSGTHGITDLGNIRIVRRGFDISGRSTSSHLVIAGSGGGSSGSSGSGERRFAYQTRNGVTSCEWGDSLTFSISDRVLHIGGRRVPFDDAYKVVFVNEENTVEAVVKVRPGETP